MECDKTKSQWRISYGCLFRKCFTLLFFDPIWFCFPNLFWGFPTFGGFTTLVSNFLVLPTFVLGSTNLSGFPNFFPTLFGLPWRQRNTIWSWSVIFIHKKVVKTKKYLQISKKKFWKPKQRASSPWRVWSCDENVDGSTIADVEHVF